MIESLLDLPLYDENGLVEPHLANSALKGGLVEVHSAFPESKTGILGVSYTTSKFQETVTMYKGSPREGPLHHYNQTRPKLVQMMQTLPAPAPRLGNSTGNRMNRRGATPEWLNHQLKVPTV